MYGFRLQVRAARRTEAEYFSARLDEYRYGGGNCPGSFDGSSSHPGPGAAATSTRPLND